MTPEIKKANKLQNYDGVLSVYQKDLSGKAPNLVIVEHTDDTDGQHPKTKTIDLSKLKTKYTLLVFYKSGCGPCEELMQGLQANYKDLTAKGIEIITVAADTDEQVFKNTAAQLPWTNNYCDLQGISGINFKNYAVIGTPTLYLLDKKGFIIQKFSGIIELLAWSNALKK